MSHPTSIEHVLWDGLRSVYRDFRKVVATAQEHGGQAIVVSENVETVTGALGRHHYGPNWEFSYNKRGEDMNLAQIEHSSRAIHDHTYVWWQTHVRGWTQGDDSVRLRAHYELEPTENDQDHIDGVGVDITRGVENVATVLDEEGLAYERYDDLPPGGKPRP